MNKRPNYIMEGKPIIVIPVFNGYNGMERGTCKV